VQFFTDIAYETAPVCGYVGGRESRILLRTGVKSEWPLCTQQPLCSVVCHGHIPQTFRQSTERVAGFGDAGGNLVVEIRVRRQNTSEVVELVHYGVTSHDSWSHPSRTVVELQHDFGLLQANSEAKSGCSV